MAHDHELELELRMLLQQARAEGWRLQGALGELMKLCDDRVRRLALRVSRGDLDRGDDDFAADVPHHLFVPGGDTPPKVSGYDSGKGRFFGWVGTVVRNAWTDRCRRRTRKKEKSLEKTKEPEAPSANNEFSKEIHLDFITPFTPSQMADILRWPTPTRIKLLLLAGLTARVADDVWESWLTEYERELKVKLPRPLPPPEWSKLDSPSERMSVVAKALGLRSNTLAQFWARNKKLLKPLLDPHGEFERDEV